MDCTRGVKIARALTHTHMPREESRPPFVRPSPVRARVRCEGVEHNHRRRYEQEDSSRAAYDRASKSAEQIRQILRSNGIEPKSAEIGFFSIQPVYDYKNPKRKLVGYRVNANVSLKLKDFLKIAPIVQQLADTDVTENQSINYTLEDMDAAKTRAVDDAYRRAHDHRNSGDDRY